MPPTDQAAANPASAPLPADRRAQVRDLRPVHVPAEHDVGQGADGD